MQFVKREQKQLLDAQPERLADGPGPAVRPVNVARPHGPGWTLLVSVNRIAASLALCGSLEQRGAA